MEDVCRQILQVGNLLQVQFQKDLNIVIVGPDLMLHLVDEARELHIDLLEVLFTKFSQRAIVICDDRG
jgi:hypothetical protein